ncbi:unnamed protein product, partial [Didymodactylos carnosus]
MVHVRVGNSHPCVDIYFNVYKTPCSLSSKQFFTSTPMYENSLLIPSPIPSRSYQIQMSSNNQSLNYVFIKDDVQSNKILLDENAKDLYDHLFNDRHLIRTEIKSDNKEQSSNRSRISKIVSANSSIMKPSSVTCSNSNRPLALSRSKNYTLKQILENVENIQLHSTNS